jgi:hypothetical protein
MPYWPGFHLNPRNTGLGYADSPGAGFHRVPTS